MSLVIPDSGSRTLSGCVMGRSVLILPVDLAGAACAVRPALECGGDLGESEAIAAADCGDSAFSRTTSRAGLSSRRPLNAAWRMRLSRVQLEKEICATNSGLTQCTPRETPFGTLANGDLDWTSLLSCLCRVC